MVLGQEFLAGKQFRAKLNGLNPEAYLREVLSRIADHPFNRIKDAYQKTVAPRL